MAGTDLRPLLLPETIAITFTVGILFGIYLIAASFANRWLIFADEGWKLRRDIRWFMVVITNLIVLFLAANVVIVVYSSMATMSLVEQGRRAGGIADPPWVAIAKCTLVDSIALLADIVLVYRLWIIYGKRMGVVWFPIFLWIGGFICTVLQLFLQVVHIHNPDFGPYQWAVVNMDIGPGIVLTPFWASTIILNAYCTGILIWRLWPASKEGENDTASKQLRSLVRILMESGILYLTVSLAHFFSWFGRDDFAIRMLGAINASVIGIAYNLIIIRTGQNRAEVHRDIGDLTTIVFNPKPVVVVEYTRSVETDDRMVYQ